ncbi:hypothetical protein [Streptomyces sp. NPDC056683]|uniref:hypothetical protein n=1 Tax=Streptomyces sp. NPDC056683 TaxID=3345910 RepID=UPI0036990E41
MPQTEFGRRSNGSPATSERFAPFHLVGVSTLLMAVAACGSSQECGGVGLVAGVGVYVVHEGYGDLARASVELCAKGKCVKDRLPDEDITSVNLPLPDDVGPDIGTVRLRITRPGADKPLVDPSAEKKLLHQSDGCGGAYNGGLASTKEEGLTAKIPKNVSAAWHKQVMERATADPASSAPSTADNRLWRGVAVLGTVGGDHHRPGDPVVGPGPRPGENSSAATLMWHENL